MAKLRELSSLRRCEKRPSSQKDVFRVFDKLDSSSYIRPSIQGIKTQFGESE